MLLGHASPEDQLKPVVSDLLAVAGASQDLEIDVLTEVHLSEHKVRPDMAVYANGLICGYLELKAAGLGANAPKLKGAHNKQQWQRLRSLPNLIYTDGREWALYRGGTHPVGQPLVRLLGDPSEVGKAAVTVEDAARLGRLIRDFLAWDPIVPQSPDGLAKYLAPLSRFLRSEVECALANDASAASLLAEEWRKYFFPDADNAKFADAYAQTVTYAMLLARLAGATKLDTVAAAKTLDANNGLLARTLELLGHPDARNELSVGFELLERSLEALDPGDFLNSKPDLWLYFYEDFLAAYDPKLRQDYGVYYTPREVVELQVRLVDELLDERFGKTLGFADDGVMFLDPAVGTGTYPVAAIRHGLDKVRDHYGIGAVPGRARQMADNMYGIEVLVGPYAVAHLRLTQALEGAINDAAAPGAPEEKLEKRLGIYLADTLESPNLEPAGGLTLTHRELTEEHEAARAMKNEGEVLVCLGNPPYDRQEIDASDTDTGRKGGWVRYGDQLKGGAKPEMQGDIPILKDFTDPVTKAGAGVHLKNLYNDYVYFWRWALWRLFEQQECGGVVAFITASSYLAGPAFLGMREVMRKTFDDLWILDLGGDNLGARKTPNVFSIRTPVAIAIGVRSKDPSPEKPAKVRYARVDASTREEKLACLESIACFADLGWRTCPDGWQKPFLPSGQGDYFDWPTLQDLFPWQHPGTQLKRSWPIGETQEVLKERWNELVAAPTKDKGKLLRKTAAVHENSRPKGLLTDDKVMPLSLLKEGAQPEGLRPYSFRSFDRQFVILDSRVGDRFRRPLVNAASDNAVFMATLQSDSFGHGPALVASAHLPDLHMFHGRGGKDIVSLYRDADGADPNVTTGLLEVLGKAYGHAPLPEELAAYVYASLGGQSYTSRFWNELETPGPRIPLTKNAKTFFAAAKLGRRLIWLHTFAERFRSGDQGRTVPKGSATTIKGVSSNPSDYPESFDYDPTAQVIAVGDGKFGPVPIEIWEFEVSGLKVVQSWLGYRMKMRAGKASSPLDNIRPRQWTPRMSDELLELLWVLEETLSMEPQLKEVLDDVISGSCFTAEELPTPTARERDEPKPLKEGGGLMNKMEGQASN